MSTPSPAKAEAKKVSGHGLPVPTINLEKAIGLMNKVWEKEKRNPAPVPSILIHWGYAVKSSGGFMAVASLKRFGLLEEHGSSEKRTLKLSQLALDLLKNAAVDIQAYRKLLKTAALTPRAHLTLWEKYGPELPSDPTLHSYLVFDLHFSEEAATQFIRTYRDTISFAKLTSEDDFENVSTSEDNGVQDREPALDLPTPSNTSFTPAKQHTLPLGLNPNIKYFAIPTDVGDAMIPLGMSEEDFSLFQQALTLFKKKIVKQSRFPLEALWSNNDFDKPVVIVGEMGEQEGVKYYRSQDGTGIPETELTFG